MTAKKMAMVFAFEIDCRHDLRAKAFSIERPGDDIVLVRMPACAAPSSSPTAPLAVAVSHPAPLRSGLKGTPTRAAVEAGRTSRSPGAFAPGIGRRRAR